jgi:hypothetical protein
MNRFHLVKYLLEIGMCDPHQLTLTRETALHGAILGAMDSPFDSESEATERYLMINYLLEQHPTCVHFGKRRSISQPCVRISFYRSQSTVY